VRGCVSWLLLFRISQLLHGVNIVFSCYPFLVIKECLKCSSLFPLVGNFFVSLQMGSCDRDHSCCILNSVLAHCCSASLSIFCLGFEVHKRWCLHYVSLGFRLHCVLHDPADSSYLEFEETLFAEQSDLPN
jgi:hypothetical protein